MKAKKRIENMRAALFSADPDDYLVRTAILQRFSEDVAKYPPSVNEVEKGLEEMLEERAFDMGQEWLVMANEILDPRFVKPLCAILDLGDPEAPNENIVELLFDLNSPESVKSLIHATEAEFDDDPNLQVPIKAMVALRRISTPDALHHLEMLRASGKANIREMARMLLDDELNN